MKERPIIFSSPMVRAILEGRKTMTRRLMKPQHDHGYRIDSVKIMTSIGVAYVRGERGGQCVRIPCPYGIPGDHLWVREVFAKCPTTYKPNGIIYRADGEDDHVTSFEWRPSIFMPRSLSRITLEITNVRVERLTDITVEDAQREGVTPLGQEGDGRRWRAAFHETWDSIYGPDAWDKNPWVWVIEFRKE